MGLENVEEVLEIAIRHAVPLVYGLSTRNGTTLRPHNRCVALRLKYPVVLASASPRRKELLARIVSEFIVDAAHLDEDALTQPDPYVTVQALAREKAMAVFERHPESLVIAGDTVVALPQGEGYMQLSKPTDPEDAVRMLTLLSGQTHVVVTGVALRWPKGLSVFTSASKVTFNQLSEDQIAAYVATGDPMDKAGAYGIQSMRGGFLAKLEGSLEGVMGLPVDDLELALRDV